MSDEGPDFAVDTYLHLGVHLYEVIGWTADEELLRVRNCRTLHDVYLDRVEVQRAEVILPLVLGEFVMPPEWAA